MLSSQQRWALILAGRGLTAAQIAMKLAISESTVKVHLQHARVRLGARNTTRAVVLALIWGVFTLEDLRQPMSV